MAIQLVSLLEENFALFSGNFLTNCSADILLVAVSERLDNKAYHRLGKHIKIRRSLLYSTVALKKLKMFRENIRNLLQYLSLVTLFFEECFSFFFRESYFPKIASTTCKCVYLFGEPNT